MSTTNTRRRLSSEESRGAAINAARALLIEAGPQAVTLKAVAARIGRTHATLLHHFGTAAGLQRALAENMADGLATKITDAFAAARAGSMDPRRAVDLCFDALGREGAALASWAVISRQPDVLAPALRVIHDLVERLSPLGGGAPVATMTLAVTLTAIGDGLIGETLATELGLPTDAVRDLVTRQIRLMVSRALAGLEATGTTG